MALTCACTLDGNGLGPAGHTRRAYAMDGRDFPIFVNGAMVQPSIVALCRSPDLPAQFRKAGFWRLLGEFLGNPRGKLAGSGQTRQTKWHRIADSPLPCRRCDRVLPGISHR